MGHKNTRTEATTFQKIIKSIKPQRKGTQTSSDGKLPVHVKPISGRKPGQIRRKKKKHNYQVAIIIEH